MTTKEEDILTSTALLKSGLAIERMLENIIVNKNIRSDDLLLGDKNALIIAARATGYGPVYQTKVQCPICTQNSEWAFDLRDTTVNNGTTTDPDVEFTASDTVKIKLPVTEYTVEARLLTSNDEKRILKTTKQRQKHNIAESSLTDQIKLFVVSVNGVTDRSEISSCIDSMPARDSRHLRNAYQKIVPNVDMTQDFTCIHCGSESRLEVPFTADFFWPDR